MGFFRKIVKLKDGEHLLIRNAIESDAAEIIKYFKKVTSETDFLVTQPDEVIMSIDQEKANNLWKEFEMRYMEVHKDFHQKLTANYPQLTANERKLCAFMVLNMSTKDISSITYQSEHSIKIARYRLRKKLGLGKNENLTAFLHNL